MTRITNADHVLLLLRNHLERTQKQRRKRPSERGAARPTPLQRVERLAASDALSEAEIKKALISGLLAEEFGEAVMNDPHFTRLVDDVLAIIERDPDAGALLSAARRQLGSPQ